MLLIPALCSASSVEVDDIHISSTAALADSLAEVSDPSDLSRLANRTDEGVLVAALAGEDRGAKRLAISLIAHLDDPGPFLPAMVELCASRDRDIASRAARAAMVIATTIDIKGPDTCVDAQCDLVDLREPMVEALVAALGTAGIGSDVKREIMSLLATQTGRRYLPDVREQVDDSLGDSDPSVRIAAATLMTPPVDEKMLDALLDAAGDDEDAGVVAACLLAACAAMSMPEGRDEQDTFEKRVKRFSTKLDPGPDDGAALKACLGGIGEPWAEALASGLPENKQK